MIRAEHATRHRAETRQRRYVLHCMTAKHHYVWTRRPVTYAEARQFVLRAEGKPRRHWFEEA